VASNQSISGPLVVLNTIVAESLDYLATKLEAATGGDANKLNAAVQTLLQEVAKNHSRVIFNGDGYSEAWHQEAEKRGLANLKTTVDSLPALSHPDVAAVFEKYGVLSKRELDSRTDIYLEQYCKVVRSESKLVLEIAKTMIYPAAVRYQGELAGTAANLKAAGLTPCLDSVNKITELIGGLCKSIGGLEKASEGHVSGLLNEAKHYCNEVLPAMLEVRKYADELEAVVADDLWPLPTYQEMLFIK
jgi:glutamine synthetase